ncbi:hypothetical protein KY359_05425 [Candidatus Woesearchaeota archaeon]|nr:hypothetical protein [Candidatus Woesearchaeota archaeon]
MSHIEVQRAKYPELLMAIAMDLKVISQLGVDKDKVRHIIGELMTVSTDINDLFGRYGGYASANVRVGYHHHLFGGKKLAVDSNEAKTVRDAA